MEGMSELGCVGVRGWVQTPVSEHTRTHLISIYPPHHCMAEQHTCLEEGGADVGGEGAGQQRLACAGGAVVVVVCVCVVREERRVYAYTIGMGRTDCPCVCVCVHTHYNTTTTHAPVEQHALGRLDAHAREELGVGQGQLDHLSQLPNLVVQPCVCVFLCGWKWGSGGLIGGWWWWMKGERGRSCGGVGVGEGMVLGAVGEGCEEKIA